LQKWIAIAARPTRHDYSIAAPGRDSVDPSGDIRGVARLVKEVIAATQGSSFRDGPKDQTRNLEIPGSLRAPE
jgi:hypothetical protein